MQTEAVVFSPQVIAVILEHQRLLAKALKTWYGITPTEYCVLRTIHAAMPSSSTSSDDLADFLMLRRSTVLGVLSQLEIDRLIQKDVDPADHRVMHVSLTEKGAQIGSQAATRVQELLRRTFWIDFPEQQMVEALFKPLEMGIDWRGRSIPNSYESISEGLPVELPIYWRTLIDKWETAVRDGAGLAFSEYRILALLDSFGGLNPTHISDRLLIERSNVSLYKRRLIARGLLRESPDPDDKRGVILQCTKAGTRVAKQLNEAVSRVTRIAHQHLSNVAITTVNALYSRMYCNLGSVRISEEELDSHR